ncbi:MAG: MBL fold metallo-hydrolase [Xanthobacteraceae bacterium]|nr:MBL fold metallo-hydrolase [Xanthobacteraceae bacterium]
MKWKVGAVTITKIVEIEGAGGTKFILPQATPDAVREMEWLIPRYATEEGKLRMAIQSYVIEAGQRRILVDTCLGNDKQGRHIQIWNNLNTPYLFKLKEAGFAPETIDTVFCTHLHVDHVGWNTKLVDGKWVSTFPNARYLFGKTEYDHWSRPDVSDEQLAVFADSVKPIMDAGCADLIGAESRLTDEIGTFPTPGHSPGHMSIRIRSEGEEAILLGDVAHHPCQFEHLDWSSTFDSDARASAKMREQLFGKLAGTKIRVFGGHFDPGYVVAEGKAFRLYEMPKK